MPVLLERHCGSGQVPGLVQDGGPVIHGLMDLLRVGGCSSRVLVGSLLQILGSLALCGIILACEAVQRVDGLAGQQRVGHVGQGWEPFPDIAQVLRQGGTSGCLALLLLVENRWIRG
jgi:hypothetical protein